MSLEIRNFGSKNGKWKGGRVISSGGYVLLRNFGHPRATKKGKYVFEHILVMENFLGRFLTMNEVVHHKNHIKTDNRIENLQILSKKDHSKLHPPKNPFKKGQKFSNTHKLKISIAKKKWWKIKNGK